MTTSRYARVAARILARESQEVAPPSPEDRAHAIGAIASALRAKRSRRRIRLAMVAAAALAAGVAAVGMGAHRSRAPAPVAVVTAPAPEAPPAPVQILAHPSGDGVTVVSAASAPLASGEALAPGSRIVARAGGHAILAFSTGTRLTVEDGGDVTLVDGGPTTVMALARGALRADVAKLREHERFLVRTDDAEVEVRGTSFRVRAAGEPCAGSVTRVEVYEGVVVVRHAGGEARVGPGDSWPARCAPARAPRAAAPSSSLAAQNDLFGEAVSAKQRGDVGGAIERFEAFLARYPSSALSESATAQRMKLLHGLDAARATSAARAYLARWPEGFARADAEGILAGAR